MQQQHVQIVEIRGDCYICLTGTNHVPPHSQARPPCAALRVLRLNTHTHAPSVSYHQGEIRVCGKVVHALTWACVGLQVPGDVCGSQVSRMLAFACAVQRDLLEHHNTPLRIGIAAGSHTHTHTHTRQLTTPHNSSQLLTPPATHARTRTPHN